MTKQKDFKPHYDAVIVGARCAGASTAMLLARAGARVLLVDRQKYGSDAVSTHALMRAGVLQLSRWGLLQKIMAAGTPAVTKTTFHYGDETVPIDIKPEHGVSFLCAPRRTVLDRVLVDAAEDAGVDVRHGVSLTDLQFGPGNCVTGVYLKDPSGTIVKVNSKVVIGADGRQSSVAKRVKAPLYVEGISSSGYVYGYYSGMRDDGFHWYFENNTAAGIIPTNDQQHCVFVGVPGDKFAETFRGDINAGFLRTAAANSSLLRRNLGVAKLEGRLRGWSGGAGYLRQSYGPGWALVGDAGYFKDPLTAHGITDALRDAEILSRAVLDGRSLAFAYYQGERDAHARPFLEVTDTIASFGWDLNEVKSHHAKLSDTMKAEVTHITQFSPTDILAA
jgi:2-polyprenyl-6-methoxyphenol hydroxylase-like FAD-dependent oxidoreductase